MYFDAAEKKSLKTVQKRQLAAECIINAIKRSKVETRVLIASSAYGGQRTDMNFHAKFNSLPSLLTASGFLRKCASFVALTLDDCLTKQKGFVYPNHAAGTELWLIGSTVAQQLFKCRLPCTDLTNHKNNKNRISGVRLKVFSFFSVTEVVSVDLGLIFIPGFLVFC